MRIQMYLSLSVLVLIQNFASVAASRLSPPVNVSIHCDNYGVEVRWEYPDPGHDVHFQVEVKSELPKKDQEINRRETQNMSMNISSMLFRSEYNTYRVEVTAVRGEDRSNTVDSKKFSFNENSGIECLKCRLDFPKVELSAKDGKLHVKFVNPVHMYRNTPALRDLKSHLEYYVTTQELENEAKCEKDIETCETSIDFSEHVGNYCVSVSGEIGQRVLNPTSGCFIGDIRIYTPFTVYLYPLLGVVATILVLTCIFLLLAKKFNEEIKKAVPSLPTSLDIKAQPCVFTLEPDCERFDDHLLVLDLEEPTDQTTLLEDEQPKDLEDEAPEKNSLYPANQLSDDESFESGEGYDMGHGLRVEMIPGEFLEAYGHEVEQ